MPTFFQKLALAFQGWQRRRAARDAEFLQKNAGWGSVAAAASAAGPARPTAAEAAAATLDLEGLQVAFLDDSGHFAHFYDTATGEVLDHPIAAIPATMTPPRYRRIPARTAASEAADRRAFVDQLDFSKTREHLMRAVNDAAAFRSALSGDRKIERAWYNFKNDRATDAIKRWLAG